MGVEQDKLNIFQTSLVVSCDWGMGVGRWRLSHGSFVEVASGQPPGTALTTF